MKKHKPSTARRSNSRLPPLSLIHICIAQTEAQKSSDLFMKCRYLDEITGGRGIVFATGTPISNSMVELYTIQRYLQIDVYKRQASPAAIKAGRAFSARPAITTNVPSMIRF